MAHSGNFSARWIWFIVIRVTIILLLVCILALLLNRQANRPADLRESPLLKSREETILKFDSPLGSLSQNSIHFDGKEAHQKSSTLEKRISSKLPDSELFSESKGNNAVDAEVIQTSNEPEKTKLLLPFSAVRLSSMRVKSKAVSMTITVIPVMSDVGQEGFHSTLKLSRGLRGATLQLKFVSNDLLSKHVAAAGPLFQMGIQEGLCTSIECCALQDLQVEYDTTKKPEKLQSSPLDVSSISAVFLCRSATNIFRVYWKVTNDIQNVLRWSTSIEPVEKDLALKYVKRSSVFYALSLYLCFFLFLGEGRGRLLGRYLPRRACRYRLNF